MGQIGVSSGSAALWVTSDTVRISVKAISTSAHTSRTRFGFRSKSTVSFIDAADMRARKLSEENTTSLKIGYLHAQLRAGRHKSLQPLQPSKSSTHRENELCRIHDAQASKCSVGSKTPKYAKHRPLIRFEKRTARAIG